MMRSIAFFFAFERIFDYPLDHRLKTNYSSDGVRRATKLAACIVLKRKTHDDFVNANASSNCLSDDVKSVSRH